MGKLAYNPQRMEQLATRLAAVADELRSVRCSDSEGMGAMVAVRTAQSEIENDYLPIVNNIRSCTAMLAGGPTTADSSDIRDALYTVMSGYYGWLVAVDPRDDDPGQVTPEEARALGHVLSKESALEEIDTVEEVEALRASLGAIAADPSLHDDFLNNLGGDWASVTDRLAWLQVDSYGRAGERTPMSDAALGAIDALGSIYADGVGVTGFETVISTMNPYSAALFTAGLPLSDEQLGRAANSILQRELYGNEKSFDDEYPGINGADHLFAELAERPVAAAIFLDEAMAVDPAVIFRSAFDGALTEQVLLAGTGPASRSEADAGTIVPELLTYLDDDENFMHIDSWEAAWVDTDGLAAAVAAPWLLNFTSRTSQWGWSNEDADQALGRLIDSDAGLDRLMEEADQLRSQLGALQIVDAHGNYDEAAVHEVAELFAKLEDAFRDEKVDDDAANRFMADLAILAGTTIVGAFLGPVGGIVLSLGTPVADKVLTELGLLPADGEMSQDKHRAVFSDRMTDTAVVAVLGAAARLVPADEFEAAVRTADFDGLTGGCQPELVNERLTALVNSLDISESDRRMLHAVVGSFINPAATVQMCD